jgi:glycine/D-amino acid oxidase-like deaminating enzyme
LRRIESNGLPAITHGIYCKSYAQLNPSHIVQEMARSAVNSRVAIKRRMMVIGLETSGQIISSVITIGGVFIPSKVVLAAIA